MTTTVQSTVSHRSFRINTLSGGAEISVVHNPNHPTVPLDLNRAEFLAAVATELDVLVIPRADLPDMDDEKAAGIVQFHTTYRDAARDADSTPDEHARDVALHALAAVEYRKAHPPIDQAQVAALANLIARTRKGQNVTPNDLAERLIRTGCITVKEVEA